MMPTVHPTVPDVKETVALELLKLRVPFLRYRSACTERKSLCSCESSRLTWNCWGIRCRNKRGWTHFLKSSLSLWWSKSDHHFLIVLNSLGKELLDCEVPMSELFPFWTIRLEASPEGKRNLTHKYIFSVRSTLLGRKNRTSPKLSRGSSFVGWYCVCRVSSNGILPLPNQPSYFLVV